MSERPQRQTVSVADKLRVLQEIDHAHPKEIGAILRREGLYSSTVTRWRRHRDAGQVRGLRPFRSRPIGSAHGGTTRVSMISSPVRKAVIELEK